MKPGALPRGNPRLPATARSSRRTTARAPQARARLSASALRPSMLRIRDSLAQPCTNSQHIAHTVQHLPSIPSHGIARALPCARARLPAQVPPRQTVGLPRPLPPDVQPCLSTCALLVRQSASVLMLRVRSQCATIVCIRPAAPDGTAATRSRATHTGAGLCVPRRPDASAHLSCAGSRATAVHCWLVLQAV